MCYLGNLVGKKEKFWSVINIEEQENQKNQKHFQKRQRQKQSE